MPLPRLDVSQRKYAEKMQSLRDLVFNIGQLEAKYQKLVAELVLLRLSAVLSDTVSAVAAKVVCGARYLDGAAPVPLVTSRSVARANHLMKTHGRRKPYKYLKWNNVRQIRDNVKHVLKGNEHLTSALVPYATMLEEIRVVRNHIAHRNANSLSHFRGIVTRYYGAYVRTVTPGMLLLSSRSSPPLLENWINSTSLLVKEIVKA